MKQCEFENLQAAIRNPPEMMKHKWKGLAFASPFGCIRCETVLNTVDVETYQLMRSEPCTLRGVLFTWEMTPNWAFAPD